MVKINRSPIPPPSLEKEKQKVNGKYNSVDVVTQLKEDFYDKCYICELKGLQDPVVEHLIPHENGKLIDMKFDWNNLFWSCNHCNGIKNKSKYSGKIINCTIEDPENHITLELDIDDVIANPNDNDETSIFTAKLIYETFNQKNTGIRIAASENRLNELKREMNILFQRLQKYNSSENSAINKRIIGALLKNSSAFAGFKRSYIRKNISKYPEFEEFIISL